LANLITELTFSAHSKVKTKQLTASDRLDASAGAWGLLVAEWQKGHQSVSKLIEYEVNGHYSVNTHLFKAPVASICRAHHSGVHAQSFGG
jgi:hypothetical protein